MSATKSNGNGCASGACGCAPKTESKASGSDSKSSSSASASEKKPSASAKPVIQNGKGSAPRNVGPQFKRNFTRINWGTEKRIRVEGRKEVKVYG